MKSYILPAALTLAVSFSPAFAEQAAEPAAAMPVPPAMPTPPAMPATPPAAVMPGAPGAEMPADYQKMMQERADHMKSMQEYQQKMAQTTDPAERQKLMDEYNQKMQEHMEKMRAMGMPGMGRGPMGGPMAGGPMGAPMAGQGGPWRMQVEERLNKIEKSLEEIQNHMKSEGK